MPRPKKHISISVIRDLFIVDPETGQIFWREPGMGRHRNRPAGTKLASGYCKIGMREDGKFVQFYCHHIVWAWCHDQWPTVAIDHINGIKDDNRIANLRLATDSQQRANVNRTRYNKSGHKWVCLHNGRATRGIKNCWQAAVWLGENRRQKFFATPDEAYMWAKAQAQELHGPFYNPGVP